MNKPQRATVRAGALERTLEGFNAEMGQKVALVLETYHARHVAPLEARIAELETPLWMRLWLRVLARPPRSA